MAVVTQEYVRYRNRFRYRFYSVRKKSFRSRYHSARQIIFILSQ
jgi:hypothetical protein